MNGAKVLNRLAAYESGFTGWHESWPDGWRDSHR